MNKQITKENLYLFAMGAVALDLGSTVIVTLRRGSFAEFNPIAQSLGFHDTIVYGLVILAVVSLALLKWGVSWGRRRDKMVILTHFFASEVFITRITTFLHSYRLIAMVHSYRDFYVLIGVSFLFAALVSFLINRQILLQ